MKKTLWNVIKLMLPLSPQKKEIVAEASNYLESYDLKDFKYYFKMGWLEIDRKNLGNKKLGCEKQFMTFHSAQEDPELENICSRWNDQILEVVEKSVFKDFSTMSGKKILKMIAPNIVGMDAIKEATMLQLFAKEKVHILLLGDPGTGKTDIIRSVSELAPISSFGLGSGTSGAGLTLAVQGKEVLKGLLPLADKGLCCIDELNLMKDKDRGGLLNAMEKGFVTYDKGNSHTKLQADVKVLGTANPKGDQFSGWLIDTLKKQLPFDPALLTRFHLVFLVRRPNVEEFKNIAEKIVSGDAKSFDEEDKSFVREYVKHSELLSVKFSKKLEKLITDFVEEIKTNEDKYFVDVSPRLVVGMVRLCKASARSELREEVSVADVKRVIGLMRNSLEIPRK